MDKPSALEIATQYAAAIIARDSKSMRALRSEDCITDWVHEDAFRYSPDTAKQAIDRYEALFVAFPDLNLEVKRTIAAEEVVVQEWTLTGTNKGIIAPPLLHNRSADATGHRVILRGISVYDISNGLIQRETIYLDNATWSVELGVDV